MHHGPGQCSLTNFDFQILPHVLRAYLPNKCPGEWPWIDFSMGFPDPWQLRFTDISIPSQHVQDGVRYDAEVVLSHVYSKNNPKKLVSPPRLGGKTCQEKFCPPALLELTACLFRSATWPFFLKEEKNQIITTSWNSTYASGGPPPRESKTPVGCAVVAEVDADSRPNSTMTHWLPTPPPTTPSLYASMTTSGNRIWTTSCPRMTTTTYTTTLSLKPTTEILAF